jgi:hypothetical protein
MKIRFQDDNDLHEDILRAAKRLQPAIDFQRAPELNLHTGIEDPEVLRLWATQNRIIVTHDRHPDDWSFYRVIKKHDSLSIFIGSRRLSISKAAELMVLSRSGVSVAKNRWRRSKAEIKLKSCANSCRPETNSRCRRRLKVSWSRLRGRRER